MKKLTDKKLLDNEWIIKKIQDENAYQLQKHGLQSRLPFEWLTYTTEELGELAQAITDYEYGWSDNKESIVEEAVQVATLALKIAEMYEKSEN